MKNGIDISKWQGSPNWDKLAAEHKAGRLDFVILRAGYGGGTIDHTFNTNYNAAHSRGIPIGAYWYAYWGNYTPTQEIGSFLSATNGKVLQYGLWYDVEYEPDILNLSKTERTNKVLEGLSALAASKRYVGLYASTDMINNRLEYDRLKAYDIWVAQYASKNTCKMPYGIWQYTSTGKIDGITSNVDCDRAYKDYQSFVVGPLAGENKTTGGNSTALPNPAPGQESQVPRETVTRKYGPMTRGDLLHMFDTADKLGLYIMGELTIGPASTGDDKTLQKLAEELELKSELVG